MEIAKKLIQKGMNDEEIAEICNMSLEEIRKIKMS